MEVAVSQCGKTRIFCHLEKIFREINSLVTSLIKPLLSRNFCEENVTENFRDLIGKVWRKQKFTLAAVW